MTDDGQLRRPTQVTFSTVVGLFGAALVVIGVFDTMARTHSVDARDAIAKNLSQPPFDMLGLTTAQVLDIWRIALYVTAVAAAVAFVLGFYVLQRHNPARIGFTVAAGVLLLSLLASGWTAAIVVGAALGLWTRDARDWFAGRAPSPEPERQPVTPLRRPEPPRVTSAMSEQTPPPAAYPYGSPHPPPEQDPPQQQQPQLYPPQQYPPQQYPPQQYPPGYPLQQYPPQQPWPTYGPPAAADPDRRPRSVLVAVILTWVGCALAALGFALVLGMLSDDNSSLVRNLRDSVTNDQSFRDLDVTVGQVIDILRVSFVIGIIWCVVAAVLAAFVLRRKAWARIMLLISGVVSGLLSLVAILSGIALVPLALSVAVVVLLLVPSTNGWFASRGGPPPGGPPGYPPGYPPSYPPMPGDKPW